MRISDIQRTKAGRYSVFVDGEFLFSLHADIYYSSCISIGEEISSAQLEEIKAQSDEKSAVARALRLLSARAYTEKMLMEKLTAHVGEDAAEFAAGRMKELGLIDDLDYARRFLSERMRVKGHSAAYVARELRSRGISREIEEQVLEELEEDCDEDVLKALIVGKYSRLLGGEPKERDRAIRALMRMGHPYSEIRRVLREIEEDES